MSMVAKLEATSEQALENSTDWSELYAQMISLGVSDPLFNAERFHLVPVKLLKALADSLSKHQQQKANIDGSSVAKLACLVHSALGGKKSSVSIEAFLPFDLPKDKQGIQESTISAMKWALKNEKMPPAIVGMIGAELA